MGAPSVAVVVATYRRPDLLRRLVAALEQQTLSFDHWEAVIVDDCSDDDTGAVLAELAASSPVRVRTLATAVNRGPAIARNLGWQASSAPFIAFTDDDCVPEPQWLMDGMRALESDRALGIVQGKTVSVDNGRAGTRRPWARVRREVTGPTPFFEGCNLFARREAVEATGGFDEGFGFFGEDTELGWSILDDGWRRGWAPTAIVRHDVDERSLSWHLRIRYLERNVVVLAARHPRQRDLLWRRWAVKPHSAQFACAVLGLALATRWRPALALTIPYLRTLPRPWRGRNDALGALFQVACDSVALVGKAGAGVRHRVLVL